MVNKPVIIHYMHTGRKCVENIMVRQFNDTNRVEMQSE